MSSEKEQLFESSEFDDIDIDDNDNSEIGVRMIEEEFKGEMFELKLVPKYSNSWKSGMR